MGLHLHDGGLLTVPAGQNASNTFNTQSALGSVSAGGLDIYCPATFQAETYTLQVAPFKTPQPTDFLTLQWQPGTDVVLVANRCVSVPFGAGARALRIFCTSGNAVADRVFRIVIQVASEMDGDF